MALQDFTIYITNVPSEIWRKEIVGSVYRVRWRVELIFKEWKQLFRINVMKGSRPERIRCLIYGRLIMILLVNSIYSLGSLYAYIELKREVSAVKLIQWLKRKERLSNSLLSNEFDDLFNSLLERIPKILLKQKRKRKTTFELLEEEIPFLESFQNFKHDDEFQKSFGGA